MGYLQEALEAFGNTGVEALNIHLTPARAHPGTRTPTVSDIDDWNAVSVLLSPPHFPQLRSVQVTFFSVLPGPWINMVETVLARDDRVLVEYD